MTITVSGNDINIGMTPTEGQIVFDATDTGDPAGITVVGQDINIVMRNPTLCPQPSGALNIGMVATATATYFKIKVTQDYEGVIGWPANGDEWIRIDIEDTDGNYYSSVYLRGDDLEYWTLNDSGEVWEYQPYIEEEGEDYQYNVVASYTIWNQTWALYWDGWPWDNPLELADPEAKYFITANCPDCPNTTQYPYRYKNADKGNEVDAVSPGTYNVAVPIFKYLDVVPDFTITYATFSGNGCAIADELLDENPVRVSSVFYYDYIRDDAYEFSIKIKSSIPYTYSEGILLSYGLPTVLYTFTPGTEGEYITGVNPGSEWLPGDPLQGGVRYCVDYDSSVNITVTGDVIDYSATPATVGTSNLLEQEEKLASGSEGKLYTIETEFISNVRPVINAYYYKPGFDPAFDTPVATTLPVGTDVGLRLYRRAPSLLSYCYASAIIT